MSKFPEIIYKKITLCNLESGTPVFEADPYAPLPKPGHNPAMREAVPRSNVQWMVSYPLNDSVFNKGGAEGWTTAMKLRLALEEAMKARQSYWEIDNDDWEMLHKAASKPAREGWGLDAGYAAQFLPFVNAIRNAADKRPRPKVNGKGSKKN